MAPCHSQQCFEAGHHCFFSLMLLLPASWLWHGCSFLLPGPGACVDKAPYHQNHSKAPCHQYTTEAPELCKPSSASSLYIDDPCCMVFSLFLVLCLKVFPGFHPVPGHSFSSTACSQEILIYLKAYMTKMQSSEYEEIQGKHNYRSGKTS